MTQYTEAPFNYTGSKFGLLPQIVPLMDRTKRRFVDLFCGGGSVYSNVTGMYQEVVANDIIRNLVDIQSLLIKSPDETIAKVKGLAVSKDDQAGYHALRDAYNAEPTPWGLWALMCCCTNNMMRFNRQFKFNQTFGRRTFNANTEAKARKFAARVGPHLGSLIMVSEDFEKVQCGKDCMVYLDPPYSNSSAGYNCYWLPTDDVRLYRHCLALDCLGASFAVSGAVSHAGEGCWLISLLLDKGYRRVDIKKNYNKVSRAGDKATQEVLVCNYEPPEQDDDPFFASARED
jgi:DNA adenine methylase Dam